MLVVAAAMLSIERPAAGVGLPADQLTYLVSGAHLRWTGRGDRLRAAESGEYVARNVVPARMAMRHDGTVYLAMPRFRRGVPFTLGSVDYDPCVSAIEPPIAPYPCAAAHRRSGPGNWTMVNVVDVYMDDAGVLWALDVGKVNLLDDRVTVVRPPMVFAFDTDTDEIVRAIDLSRATTAASCLQSIVVDHSTSAGQLVYVTDAGSGNVIVYNVGCDRSFKVHVPVGPCGRRDVMYAALAQVDVMNTAAGGGATRHRRLYVTYLSACDMMYVPVHIADETTTSLATVAIGRKPCKMIVLGADRGSVIYFRTSDAGDVLSWDVNRPFRWENFRSVRTSQKSRIPLMMTVGFQGYMWFIESNFIDFLMDDIGCMGVSTIIQPLRRRQEDGDDRCATPVSSPCSDRGVMATTHDRTKVQIEKKGATATVLRNKATAAATVTATALATVSET